MAAIYEEYDITQASIDVDALFVAKLQQEDREQYTIEERAKFLAETIEAQRKFKADQRAAEIRSRPPTKTKLRNLMMTYLKNMGGYKHSQLKGKDYEENQGTMMEVHAFFRSHAILLRRLDWQDLMLFDPDEKMNTMDESTGLEIAKMEVAIEDTWDKV
ncbi:hypothetical protein Tco_0417011 [Tanacetum coccineum]